jgi:2-keto-4-pentenoate hydratase/2-oxohepta-3-ene-1,7-dioic acid hydratase in catechol pathway
MVSPKGADLERGWPGRIEGDRVVQLAAQTLQAFFTGGGRAREHAEYPLAEVDLRAPVLYPPTVRVFAGLTLDFAFGNTSSIHGPEDDVPYPEGETKLDFGTGIAAVIGKDGAVGGYTIANTWLAPSLPSAKKRDFALSIGPVVVTTDLDEWKIRGSVAGREGYAETPPYKPDWNAVAAHAARSTRLRPGDLLVLDFGPGGVDLERGDVVELGVEDLGLLRNRVV